MSDPGGPGGAGDGLDRRDLLRLGGLAGLAAAGMALGDGAGAEAKPQMKRPGLGPAPEKPMTCPPMELVRVGYVGVGGMGTAHVRNLLGIPGCQIRAVCDIVEAKVRRVQDMVVQAGQPRPKGYAKGDWDFLRLCEQEDLDLVYTATPWRWHVPVCVAAMKNGKHAATEVPAATSVEECWQLVETAEKHRRHCLMMENCCYSRSAMMVLHMVRRGLLGQIVHGRGAYNHDCRALWLSGAAAGEWRRLWLEKHDGNLYPTHGLGPIAQCMDISRGDRFEYLVSMSSPPIGLKEFAVRQFGPDHPHARRRYACGDVNVSLIKTAKGRTVTLYFDTSLPRPYTRCDMIQGTKGIYMGFPDRIHVEGRSPAHAWEEGDAFAKYLAEFDHPLWKSRQDKARGAGHGGMDYMEDWRLIQCLRKGEPTDFDVYEAAEWSVIFQLSQLSVAKGSAPVDFPDFTRGRWAARPRLGIVG